MNHDSPGLLVALSAGGKKEELAAQGLGTEHVEELMVRLAMKLLRDGHRLAFGGTMGKPDYPLTRYLIDAAQSWLGEDSAKATDVTLPKTWPLVNYSAWPFHRAISEEQRARLVGICRFVTIDPSGVTSDELEGMGKTWDADATSRRYTADSLSAMRELSAQETGIRIVWGGTIAGSIGWMAGILEEVAFSLKYGRPVVVLGGFGGCARLLAKFLVDKKAPLPPELTLAASAHAERDKLQEDSERNDLEKRFEQARADLIEFRSQLHSDDSVNGLPSKLVHSVLLEENARRAIHIAATLVGHCHVAE